MLLTHLAARSCDAYIPRPTHTGEELERMVVVVVIVVRVMMMVMVMVVVMMMMVMVVVTKSLSDRFYGGLRLHVGRGTLG